MKEKNKGKESYKEKNKNVAEHCVLHKKTQQYAQAGITLVALVVTIIILLILAGVTVSLVVGENGLLQRAQTASNTMANATANEQAMMGEMESEIDRLAQGNGAPGEETGGGGTSVTELREGDEVIYTDQNGSEIPCIVLYDSTGSNGIQIISAGLVGNNIEIGNGTGISSYSTNETDFAIAKASYNTAIATLNNVAMGYLNTHLATNARCVGSSPSETPITSEDDSGTYTNNYSYFSSFNNQFKPSSPKNSNTENEDWLQMKKIGCHSLGSKQYFMASRSTDEYNSFTAFSIKGWFYNSDWFEYRCFNRIVCDIKSNGTNRSNSISAGLRPVFILKSDIHYKIVNEKKQLVQ